MVHSGAVDYRKSKVWNFVGPMDHHTCDICQLVMGGNPYTTQARTSYGAVLHPNCRHHWESEWQLDPATRKELARKVRDGEITLWDGRGRTPAAGQVAKKLPRLQPAKGGWSGRASHIRRQAARAGRRLA